MKKALTRISILAILAFSTNGAWSQTRVYISADVEGVAGAVRRREKSELSGSKARIS